MFSFRNVWTSVRFGQLSDRTSGSSTEQKCCSSGGSTDWDLLAISSPPGDRAHVQVCSLKQCSGSGTVGYCSERWDGEPVFIMWTNIMCVGVRPPAGGGSSTWPGRLIGSYTVSVLFDQGTNYLADNRAWMISEPSINSLLIYLCVRAPTHEWRDVALSIVVLLLSIRWRFLCTVSTWAHFLSQLSKKLYQNVYLNHIEMMIGDT